MMRCDSMDGMYCIVDAPYESVDIDNDANQEIRQM